MGKLDLCEGKHRGLRMNASEKRFECVKTRGLKAVRPFSAHFKLFGMHHAFGPCMPLRNVALRVVLQDSLC